MLISRVIPQLRTTNLRVALDFDVETLGFTLEFVHDDFYAGVKCGEFVVHLKMEHSRMCYQRS